MGPFTNSSKKASHLKFLLMARTGLIFSNLTYACYYPTHKLSRFAITCHSEETPRSKAHYIWLIPTQAVCCAITIPLCVTAAVIHLVTAAVFGALSKVAGENKGLTVRSRLVNLVENQNETSAGDEYLESLRSQLIGELNDESLAVSSSANIKLNTLNEKIKETPYFFDAADAHFIAFEDSLIFSVRSACQIFSPSYNANYLGLTRSNIWEYRWDPRVSL